MMYQSLNAIGKWRVSLVTFLLMAFLSTLAFSQERTGEGMLLAADQRNNLPADIAVTYRMTVKVSSGENRVMEFVMKQKGNKLRMIKFTSPDTLNGMGFLTTGPGVLFGVMPGDNRANEFPGSAASQTIAGSDMILEDIYTMEYAPYYLARHAGREPGMATLGLTVKPKTKRVYPSVEISMNPRTHVISKIIDYDSQGNKKRTILFEDYAPTKVAGFTFPRKIRFIGHDRQDLETELVVLNRLLNTGMSDDEFNTVALTRK